VSWWEAIVLGVVQGLTEFFPVSSSGHLVMGQALLGLEIPGILFDVVVHVATLFSVMIVYRRRLLELVVGVMGRDRDAWRYVLLLALATLPAVIVGFSLRGWFEARFDDPIFAGTMVLVTGCVVWSSRWATGVARIGPLELLPLGVAAVFSLLAGTLFPFLGVLALQALLLGAAFWSSRRDVRHEEVGWGTALFMGVGQALAIFPGITRSGSTVLAGLWRRLDPVKAAEFSFLMSIPAILGAAVLQVPDALREPLPVSNLALAAGFVAAALSGVVAIRFFVLLLKRQNFHVFAYYAWAAAGLFLLVARGGAG
jgi:undecaprenyl-diphosphatase